MIIEHSPAPLTTLYALLTKADFPEAGRINLGSLPGFAFSGGGRSARRRRSALRQSPEQPHGLGQHALLGVREPLADRLGEPPIALAPVSRQDDPAGIRELDHHTAAVDRVGAP